MDALLDSIRIAISEGASDDERRRGVVACHAVADALDGSIEATAPEPAAADAAAAPSVDAPPAIIPFGSNPFAGMNADQILELAIAKLRGAVGEGTEAPAPSGQPFRLTLVPIPRYP
jgi:hypothetical protein